MNAEKRARQARMNHFGRERYQLNLTLAKENQLRDTWSKLESIFQKFIYCSDFSEDRMLMERFSELMTQYRDELHAYWHDRALVEVEIEKQMVK